ncbi:hypothetical protein SeMB42_g03277 [Synchytrium endobioticum]|uniref:CBS domain-containing protein n=1 Tax=Synchytrium endobioticum TaxID=286115 RepID=A0A507CD23_9FUNG|nr:hypothetical protein SeLEV6574_g07490 [Synchytrium endobioticum]TPX47560.1 hypothetical protein SeMB42_g03277 [Synchytrium endobioticum]
MATTYAPLKQRNQRRDDALRKKLDQDIAKRSAGGRTNKAITNTGNAIHNTTGTSTASTSNGISPDTRKRYGRNTVSSLRPNQALTVPYAATVLSASQLMASKRSDAVLALDDHGQLTGILTDKDVAYRAVAEGLDLRTTLIKDVMTKNPTSVTAESGRNEALNIMVERRFRHLPVVNHITDVDDEYDDDATTDPRIEVVGLLDITKCVFERLDDLEKKVLEDQNIVNAMEALNRRGNVGSDRVGAVLQGLGPPDVATVLAGIGHVPEVGPRATIREVARVMKQTHQTAVLVVDNEKLTGIVTTKDVVLRVVAAGLDPATTSVVRVMTHNPDSVAPELSILDALKKLHAGHYLHLPVVENKVPSGLVDVMQLTLSMLNYMMNKDQTTSTEGTGPVWDRFWNSTFTNPQSATVPSESDRHSVTSADNTRDRDLSNSTPPIYAGAGYCASGVALVDDSVSRVDDPTTQTNSIQRIQQISALEDAGKFAWKLRDPSTSRVHRFTASYKSLDDFTRSVRNSLSIPPFNHDGVESALPDKLYFLDEDGDSIQINSDSDLTEAVDIAKRVGWNRVVLYLGEPRLETRVADTAAQLATARAAELAEAASREVESSHDEKKATPVAKELPIPPMVLNVALSASVVLIVLYIYNRYTRD